MCAIRWAVVFFRHIGKNDGEEAEAEAEEDDPTRGDVTVNGAPEGVKEK